MFNHEFFWPIFGALFIFALLLLGILRHHLNEKRKIAIREIMQKERIVAMEKSLPLPEWDQDLLSDSSQPKPPSNIRQHILWFRLLSLCLGLFMFFAGIGMLLGFSMSEDLRSIAPIGMVPTMIGVGLLLFYRLSGRVTLTTE
jgi:hypothetical protein